MNPPIRSLVVLCLYVVLSLLLYFQSLEFGLLGDDWYFVRKAWTRSPYQILVPPFDPSLYHYVPVGELSIWLQLKLFGLWAPAWHAVNLALHAVNAWLVWNLASRLGLARAASLSAGVFFVSAFQSYESVMWVSGIFYVLATTLFTAGLVSFASFLSTGRVRWYAGYLTSFAAALLTIEAAATLPGIACLMEILGLAAPGRTVRERIVGCLKHQLPAVLVFAAYWYVRSTAARSSMHDVPPLKMVGTLAYSLFGLAALNLPPVYSMFFAWKKFAAATVLLALGWAVTRKDRFILFALTAYVLTWSPFILFSGFNTRYFYLPGVFSALMFAAVMAQLSRLRTLHIAFLAPAAALATAIVATPYRMARIHEWRHAAVITRATLGVVRENAGLAPRGRGTSLVAVDAPDSLGTQWGPAFPAYVFRNGLPEAIGLSLDPGAPLPHVWFVASEKATAHVVKRSAGAPAPGLPRDGRLVFDADDPAKVSFESP